MYFHGILLAMMNVVNADTNYLQWSYIEIPSHWNASSAQTTLLCAFKMFRSNYAQVSNGSTKCTLNYNRDTVLPEYTDYNNYKELIQFKDFRPLDGKRRETVLHNLSENVKIGDKFRFVILKLQHKRFEITFQRNSGEHLLYARISTKKFILKDQAENGSWGPAEITSTYPFNDLTEYKIEFKVLAEHWQIFIDGVAFTIFVHRQPFTKIGRIKVLTLEGVTLQNKLNIMEP